MAKQSYLDPSLCMLVYENAMHFNAQSEHCHGSMVSGFQYALGIGISEDMKYKIAKMHAFGLSPAQIMQQHTKEVRELALANGPVTRDTFMLPSDVRNIVRKRTSELWMKHPSDPGILDFSYKPFCNGHLTPWDRNCKLTHQCARECHFIRNVICGLLKA